ncbi:MAG TPA: ATP-grasp domain-containing protein, partial [Acidimicrobiales bacterium]
FRILGTPYDAVDLAEDRERFAELLARLGIRCPEWGIAASGREAAELAHRIGYPVLVRPSYVLGGRAMRVCYRANEVLQAFRANTLGATLVDRFVEDAIEIDVDAVSDGEDVLIGAVMEHVEEAGVHSGDSACSIPPHSLTGETVAVIEDYTRRLAGALDVRGLLNVQYAVKQGQVFVIEANPRASRTVPFVAKATGVPLVKVAARVMLGATLDELRAEGLLRPPVGGHIAVKEAVLPFNRFPDVDTVLGPEMRSTGEVMGIDRTFGLAFGKAQISAGDRLPESGTVFVSLADRDKPAGVRAAARLVDLGFDLAATDGTADYLERHHIRVAQRVAKVMSEDEPAAPAADGRPTAVDLIAGGQIALVVNSPRGRGARADGAYIRRAANVHRIPCLTTAAAALAAAESSLDRSRHERRVRTLQEYHQQ